MILPFPFLPLPLSPILLLPLLFIPLSAPSWLMLPFSPFRPSPSTLGCAYSSFGRGERDQEEGKKHVRTYMGGGVGEEKREPGEKGGPEGGREGEDGCMGGGNFGRGRKKEGGYHTTRGRETASFPRPLRLSLHGGCCHYRHHPPILIQRPTYRHRPKEGGRDSFRPPPFLSSRPLHRPRGPPHRSHPIAEKRPVLKGTRE